jgi:hypothetical protein
MNTIGIFAGRGDVLVAMAFALVIGAWAGWQFRRLVGWVQSKVKRSKT